MNKILVLINKGGVGDALISTPALTALRRANPGARIVVLAGPHNAEVFTGNPFINDVWVDEWNGAHRGLGFLALWRRVARERFDAAIVLWSTARMAYLTFLAGIPIRVGRGERLVPRLLFNVKAQVRPEADHESHWMEFVLDHVRTIGVSTEGVDRSLVLAVPEAAHRVVDGFLASYNLDPRRPLMAVHAGKGIDFTAKRWPHHLFARVADLLVERYGAQVILTGGPSEAAVVEKVAALMKQPAVNLAGQLSLKELAALLSRCALLVCPDSGPMHVAAAMRVPIVATFNMKSDLPFRWYPFGAPHVIVRQPTACQDRCIKEQCLHFTCMHELTPEQIVAAAGRLLEEIGKAPGSVIPLNVLRRSQQR